MNKKAHSLFLKSFYILLVSLGILLINYTCASGDSATATYVIFHYLGVILFLIGAGVGVVGFFADDKGDNG